MSSLIKENHRITPRRPSSVFSETPSHWIYDDPMASQILNVINPITPAPERWFCQTFRDALPFVKDEKLKQAAIAFIKQEAAHSHGHTLGTRHIEQLGINLDAYTSLMNRVFNDILGSHPLGFKLRQPMAKKAWLHTRLAMVAAAEHVTGALGHWILNAKALEQAPVDREMLQLLQWHGAEEVEHREVADAMLRHLSNSILLRNGAALVTFPLFATLAYIGIEHLVQHDPSLPHRFRIKDYLRAARQERVPSVNYMLKAGLRYFNPQHSPLNEGSTEQALAYLKQFSGNRLM